MSAHVTIEYGAETYRLKHKGVLSDEAEYGDPCLLLHGVRFFVACVHETDDGEKISLLNSPDGEQVWVVQGFQCSVKFGRLETESSKGGHV